MKKLGLEALVGQAPLLELLASSDTFSFFTLTGEELMVRLIHR